jgi:hypothetical protein
MRAQNPRQAVKSVLVVLVIAICGSIAVVLARMPPNPDDIPWMMTQNHADEQRRYWSNFAVQRELNYTEVVEKLGQIITYHLYLGGTEIDSVQVKIPWRQKNADPGEYARPTEIQEGTWTTTETLPTTN